LIIKGLYDIFTVKSTGCRAKVFSDICSICWVITGNGGCYIAHETKAFARMIGLKPVTTPASSPQSNGMAESFVKTLKRDYAALADKPDASTVMQKLNDWFEHYNNKHPHSALNYLSPRMFRQKQMEAL